MDIEKLIKILEIKNPTDKIREHPKMLQLLQYIKLHDIYSNVPDENIIFTENGEEDDVEYPVFDYDNFMYKINEDAFITLLENINSFEVLIKMLRREYLLVCINYNALEDAKFFNIYDPDVVIRSLEADILVDEEYLKYASVEWTVEVLMKHPKVLQIKGKKLTLKDNVMPEYNSVYWDTDHNEDYIINKFRFELNLRALNKAKKLGLLKEAIKMLSE